MCAADRRNDTSIDCKNEPELAAFRQVSLQVESGLKGGTTVLARLTVDNGLEHRHC